MLISRKAYIFSLRWQTSSVINKVIFIAQITQEFSTGDTKHILKAVQSLRSNYPTTPENNKHRKFQQFHEIQEMSGKINIS